MAEENKDLSVEEAQKIIQENKDVNGASLPVDIVEIVEDENNDKD